MGTRERYEHGVFSYVELASGDVEAAKPFYERLFGWTYDDVPLGDDMTYHPASKDGKRVAAVYQTQREAGWLNYVTVDDLDATAGKVDDLGGTVTQKPFDVMDQGRMAVVTDPTGATLALWEPKENAGAELVNAAGALAWNDLQTTDVAKAAEFYAELLGWELGEVEDAPDERQAIRVGEGLNGGIAKLPDSSAEAGVPSHWVAFFAVDDVGATVELVEDSDGTVLAGPIDVPSGRMAVITDPGGVIFGIVDGELDE